MTRGLILSTCGAALLAAFAAPALHAQALRDWSLPAPGATPTPSAQGPVDAQNPVVRPAAPAETPPAAPTVVLSPAPPQPATAAPSAPPPSPRPDRSPGQSIPAPAPSASPPASPEPAPAATPEVAVPVTLPAPVVAPAPRPASAAAPAADGNLFWWWALGAAVLVAGLGLALLRSRRGQPEEVADWEYPDAAPEPAIDAEPAAAPAPAVARGPAPAPVAAPPAMASGELDFAPVGLRLSLVYATLQYTLRLNAGTDMPAGRIFGDMISAHGSLPQAMQLEPALGDLPELHRFGPLAAGESCEWRGELRLPLNAVRLLQHGNASFLVPLVRLALLGEADPAYPHLELGCAFTVGLRGAGPALAPLRFDAGPRDFRELDTREIAEARRNTLIALDPARAAG